MDKNVAADLIVVRIKEFLAQDPNRKFITVRVFEAVPHYLLLSYWLTPCKVPLQLLIDTCLPTRSFEWFNDLDSEEAIRLTVEGMAKGLKGFKSGKVERTQADGKNCWNFTFERT